MRKSGLFKKCMALFLIHTFVLSTIPYLFTAKEAHAESVCWNEAKNIETEGGNRVNPGDCNSPGQPGDLDDVNLHTGNFDISQRDFFIPSRGMPLEIVRTYNSQDPFDGPFGFGWNHNLAPFYVSHNDDSDSLSVTDHPALTKRNPDGTKDRFYTEDGVTYTASRLCYDRLTREDSTFFLTEKHGTVWKIDAASGHVILVKDRNGNALNFVYDANGRLVTVSDGCGKSLSFSYGENSKVSKITDHTSRTFQYCYDKSNNLISATNPEGYTVAYGYNPDHRLASITDASGTTWLTNAHDMYGRVAGQFADGGTYRVSYDGGPTSQKTTVTQANGSQTVYEMDEYGQATKVTRDFGKMNLVTTSVYDKNGHLSSRTNPRGYTTRYKYDKMGNLLKIRRKASAGPDNDETDIVATFTYEPDFNFIKTVIDPLGNVTTFSYDEAGNLLKIAYPAVGESAPETTFTYNDYGQVTTMTDPNGVVTGYEYDASFGYLSKIINDYGKGNLNYTYEIAHDMVGNITSVTDARGNNMNFEYNGLNRLVRSVAPSPFEYVTLYTYDKNGNLKKVDRQTGNNDDPWQTTSYTYTAFDRLETVTDDMGHVTTFGYDASGNRISARDANGNQTTYAYNKLNLLSKVTSARNGTTEYTYDANGNLAEIKDARGYTTTYVYDPFDRLVQTTYPDENRETYQYDKAGNLMEKTDRKNQVINYSYDPLNRLDIKTYPDGSTITHAYDPGSRLTDVTGATGKTSYTYDRVSRLTGVSCPDGKTVSYDYDANGNRTKLVYPDATWINYTYDELNRMTGITDSANNDVARYAYDALSRRTGLYLANNTETLYQYDDANRLLSLINKVKAGADISTFTYSYDSVRNRRTMTTDTGTHSYSYDKIDQLTAADYPDGFSFPDTAYNYDAVGNRTSVDNGGATAYKANNMNQYTDIGGTSYTYDANGNLTGDGINTYSYDYENRLVQAVTPDHPGIVYKYDPFGKRLEKNVDGVITRFVYDGARVIGEYDENGSQTRKFIYGPGIDEPVVMDSIETGKRYYYHFDGLGSVTGITDASHALVEKYEYSAFGKPAIKDAFDNLLTESAIGNPYLFTARRYEPDTGLFYYRARYYDPQIGRFLQKDPLTWAPNDPRIAMLGSLANRLFTAFPSLRSATSVDVGPITVSQSISRMITGFGLKDPQLFHAYLYVKNNPINLIDPWGLCTEAGWRDALTKILTGEAIKPLIAKHVDSPAGQRIITAGIAGAAGGAVLGATVGTPLVGIGAAPSALGGAIVGSAGNMLKQIVMEAMGLPGLIDNAINRP